MGGCYLKRVLADFTTTSVYETTQRFGSLKTPFVIMCLNLLIIAVTSKSMPINKTKILQTQTCW